MFSKARKGILKRIAIPCDRDRPLEAHSERAAAQRELEELRELLNELRSTAENLVATWNTYAHGQTGSDVVSRMISELAKRLIEVPRRSR